MEYPLAIACGSNSPVASVKSAACRSVSFMIGPIAQSEASRSQHYAGPLRASSMSSNGTTPVLVTWTFSWPFARDQHNVSCFGFVDRPIDSAAAIRLQGVTRAATLQAGEHIIHDVQRILVSRIVAGKHHEVAATSRRFAHQRTLAAITVATAPENRDHPPGTPALDEKIPGHRGQVAQRVVGMRIVHDDGKRLAKVHTLEAPRRRE